MYPYLHATHIAADLHYFRRSESFVGLTGTIVGAIAKDATVPN
jgi:hypothetical protein